MLPEQWPPDAAKNQSRVVALGAAAEMKQTHLA